MKTETATAVSSYGTFLFRIEDGAVILDGMDRDWGFIPIRVDVAEWHRFYPLEQMKDGDEYDILDLGMRVHGLRSHKETYEPAEKSWRIERKRSIKRGENG